MIRSRPLFSIAALGLLVAVGLMVCSDAAKATPTDPSMGVVADAGALAIDAGLAVAAASAPIGDITTDYYVDVLQAKDSARVLAMLLLIGVVYLVRRLGAVRLPGTTIALVPSWFRTDRGGVVLIFVVAVLGGVLHAWLVGASITHPALYVSAGMIGLGAIGLYVVLRRLLWPRDPRAPVELMDVA